MMEYCFMTLETRLAALFRAFLASNACFTRDEPSSKRVGGVGLMAESRQSYSRHSRCWQNGIDNARYSCRVIHAAGERS